MADMVKIRLLKGPTLQRLVVLVLLSLAGLGHSPDFCTAIRCHCRGFSGCSSSEVECPGVFHACQKINSNEGFRQGCDRDGTTGIGQKYDCVYNEFGRGHCIEGDADDIARKICECYGKDPSGCRGSPGAARQGEAEVVGIDLSDTISGRAPGGGLGTGQLSLCTCKEDLCNGGNGGDGNGNGNGGGGLDTSGQEHAVLPKRNLIQAGITGLIIIRLATNGQIL